MNNYQKQKAKRQMEEPKVEPKVEPKAAHESRITEDPEFIKAWAKYDRDLKSIPAILGDILKETLATRLLLERKR